MIKKYTVLNGVLIYTTTALLTLIIHETGHFAIERLWGFDAVMHPNYGSYAGFASDFQKIIIAGAGPLISLLQGVFFLFINARVARKNMFSLFTLWLSLHGFILFFGYMVCAPFFTYGDTGQILYLLHFPIYITIAFSILCLLLLVKTLRNIGERFAAYGRNITERKSRTRQIILYPLIIGGILSLLAQLPVPNLLLLFDCLTTPLMFLIVYGKLMDDHLDNPQISINRISVPLIIIFLFTLLGTRLLI